MGCACTKGELIGPGKNGFERRSSQNETVATKKLTEISRADKSTSGLFRGLSLKKPFNSLFKEQKELKFNELDLENNKNNQNEPMMNPNTIQIQATPIPDQINQSKKLNNSFYSFLNLPVKTQNLLNAQHEFDCEFDNFLASNDEIENLFKNYSLKSNKLKEIKLYLSTSQFDDNDLISNISTKSTSVNDVLFGKLSSYCAQSANGCDFNLINFNNKTNSVNKYYRRLLGKIIINDLLSISNSTINNCCSTPGYFLFVIILSDCEFDDKNNDKNLLCPDEIDSNDIENIKNEFTEQELALFQKWYTTPKQHQKYKLKETNLSTNLNELNDLLTILKHKFNDNEQLSLKYFKSIQQEEIELIVNHIDPSSIVWFNLTDLNRLKVSNLNQARYESTLKLLQSHVLAHNYKECQPDSMLNDKIFSSFLYNSIKLLIDQYIEDLNKKLSINIALKIDQHLSQELLKQYEIYKYLRVKNEFLNNKKPSRKEINTKFTTHLNEYLKTKTTKYPLIVNNYKLRPDYVSCQEIISKYISDSALTQTKNRSLIYRFCGHTIISSNLTTLIQSILHQLCYLLDIHESWSFSNISNLIDNFNKALEHKNEEDKHIIIFIDRIDRLIRSKYDQSVLINLLDKLYSNSASSHLKLVITYSVLPDLFTNLIQPVRDLFKTSSEFIIHSLSANTTKQVDHSLLLSLNNNIERLKQKLLNLFKENSLQEANSLIDILIELLCKSRYGLKQTEVFDLLRQYARASLSHFKLNLEYCIQILWFTFVNYSNLFEQFNLIETLVENNQILYRLDKQYYSNDYFKDDFKIKNLLNNYFKQAIEKPTNSLNAKLRAYEELANIYLVSNHDLYFKTFINNYSWFLNKLTTCDCNVLLLMQDLEGCKTLLYLNNRTDHSETKHSIENERDEFKLFEHLFYETIYELHQDPNQIYNQFKAYLNMFIKMNKTNHHLTNMLTCLDKHFKALHLNSLRPFNLEHLIETEVRKLDKENIKFNNLKKNLTYLSKVVFLNSNTILALSDTHNEIKIWKINQVNIDLIRSIKLNKTPRDLRLLNEKIAVILVDRNLHLFDLNESKHVLDMNSTMSANVPFFEIHDQNHVVLLARNRLSVILMKVSPPKEDTDDSKLNETVQAASTKTYSVDDDMFLFKVGEDRYLNSLLVSKNGQVMVCGDEVQKPFPLLVWNLNKRKLVYDLRQAKHEFITTIQSIGSNGQFVVCACQEEGELKNCLIVYDLLTGQMFKKLKAKFNYVSVEISEELNVLIACLENAQIVIYDLSNGSEKCILNNNRFPINKIKVLDTKNMFITYDTQGYDWTIRAWDLTKLDKHPLISSFTCPSRIISCSINIDQFNTSVTRNTDDSLIGIALFGIQQPLILKLNNQTSKMSSIFENYNTDLFNKIENFNREINL